MILNTLEDLLQYVKTQKQSESNDAETGRNLAIVYTDLQKIYAFVKTYISEESES